MVGMVRRLLVVIGDGGHESTEESSSTYWCINYLDDLECRIAGSLSVWSIGQGWPNSSLGC